MSEWHRPSIGDLVDSHWSGEWGTDPDGSSDVARVYRSTEIDDHGHLRKGHGVPRTIPRFRDGKALRQGDILVEASGGAPNRPVGRVALAKLEDGRHFTSNFVRTLRPRSSVDGSWLRWKLHWLNNQSDIWRHQQQTTGIINLKIESYLNQEIAAPKDQKEQEQIASIIDLIDTQIQATEALIAKQERLRAGLMQDLFTRGVDENGELRPPQEEAPYLYYGTELGYLPKAWSVDSFGSLIDVIDPNPSHRYPNPIEEGVPICSTENFDGEEGFNLERAQHVPTDTFTFQNSRCRFHQNDVVFARKGRIGLARRYGKNHMVFSHTIVTMKPGTESLDQLWLLWLARSGHFLDGIRREMNSNSGVPTLGIEFIKSIKVPFPEKHEQERMALLLDKATCSLEGAKADKTKLKRQKVGLMQDLLTGAVSVEPLLEREPA